MSLRFAVKKLTMTIWSRPLAAATILLLALSVAPRAKAGTYTMLYSFNGGTDGQWPVGGLVRDSNGNYYGTTQGGGASNFGTVFKVTSTGAHTVLYNFNGRDGKFPSSTLIVDSHGVLYGTTYSGGASGLGTVFQLRPQPCAPCPSTAGPWRITVLHNFNGTPDGKFPLAGLVADANGNLFGTTGYGGAYNKGTVFKLDRQGNESIVYSFTGANDGATPLAPLVLDPEGNLYGATTGGGANGMGTVFTVTPAGTETVLYSFAGATAGDGASPFYSPLTRDSSGNFYGTTLLGGAQNEGVVFKVTPSGNESILYTFCSLSLCSDGAAPAAGVIRGSDGSLYGTTEYGYYEGVLFGLTSQGGWSGLHQFWNLGGDGFYPLGPLVQDPSHALYGTTYVGGANSGNHAPAWGTVFKYTLP